MATFAKVNDQNVVVEVIKLSNDLESVGSQYLAEKFGGKWIQTWFTVPNKRKNVAALGMIYNQSEDCFENHHQPFPSWIFDNNLKRYVSPSPLPDDGNPESPNFQGAIYHWDEIKKLWVKMDAPPVELPLK